MPKKRTKTTSTSTKIKFVVNPKNLEVISMSKAAQKLFAISEFKQKKISFPLYYAIKI